MPSARHSLKTTLFLLIAVAVLLKPAAAQHEVQIMVNGPWAYVAIPASPSTIIIATPAMNTHAVFVFPGEDADQPGNGYPIKTIGAYTLDFPTANCNLIPPKPTASEPGPFPLTVTSNDANDVITGQLKGFAITLPQPCYATNFADSRARIDPTRIDTDPNKPPPEAFFTNWRVLHYSVNSPNTAIATIKNANGSVTQSFPFQKNDILDLPAISIVMAPNGPVNTNSRCDSLSVDSFLAEATLFHKTLHVQFPRLLGETQSHDYKPDCIDNAASLTQAELTKVLKDIDAIKLFLEGRSEGQAAAQQAFNRLDLLIRSLKPPANVTTELQKLRNRLFSNEAAKADLGLIRAYAIPETVGAADCRAAQLNVTIQ